MISTFIRCYRFQKTTGRWIEITPEYYRTLIWAINNGSDFKVAAVEE